MQLMKNDLRQALFAPESVAIVGQSNDESKTAGRPLKFLRQMRYAGRIYPVNPGRDTVLGHRAWRSLADLPEAPDHAYIVTPTDAAIEAVAECGTLGVKVATVLADGFTEAGEWGDMRVARLREICADHRHPRGRAVEPRHRRSAHARDAHRQRRLRRAGPAGRPHLRGLAFRQHDRLAPLARQGARGGFCRARFGRQRGRSLARRDLRIDARRPRHRRLHAVPRDHAQCRRAAPLCVGGARARQAGHRLQARPLGGGARAGGVAYRRARRRGRRRRCVPRRLRDSRASTRSTG